LQNNARFRFLQDKKMSTFLTILIVAGSLIAAFALVFTVIAFSSASEKAKQKETQQSNAAAREAEIADLRKPVSGDIENMEMPAIPEDAEAIERSKVIIHGLLMGISENIESYLNEVNDYGVSLDDHEKAIQKTKTVEALREAERILLSQIEGMRETTIEYRKRLDLANTRIARQKEEMEKLTADAASDFLTRAANRRHFDKRLSEELARFKRNEQPFSLIILDIDYFKRINDTFGHVAGDRILRAVASIINDIKRESDFLARYGGEEFALILPDTDVKRGIFMANKVRYKVENARLNYQGTAIKVTLSAGVTESGKGDDANTVIERADAALYRAKEAGRNLVEGSSAAGGRIE
jgi:diguanylate cyclase